jgi:class 3 adenylate cyclase
MRRQKNKTGLTIGVEWNIMADNMKTTYRYNTLEDFLISHPLTVDVQLDDGWGASFPVKGIELEATILFADISGFSRRTAELSPTETLIFVNNFFAWVTAEGIKNTPCIVDKYIGDEVMLVFAKEFGSDDPFADALCSARWMGERDALSFCPHIGISSGLVTAGYVGTPVKYNASLFGRPVTIAARCASVKPEGSYSSTITFPASEWGVRKLEELFPPLAYEGSDGKRVEQRHSWELCAPRDVEFKNIGTFPVRELANSAYWIPQQSAEERAREYFQFIKAGGHYRGKPGK